MANTKFSEFVSKTFNDIKDPLVNTTMNLAGVDETNEVNFKINFLELLPTCSNLGSGAEVYKNTTNLKQLNFRKIKAGSDKVTVTQNTNDISIDIVPSEINISDLIGYVPVDKGGLGTIDPDILGEDSLVYWYNDGSGYSFLQLGTGLEIDGDTINVTQESPLTTKGDMYVHTGVSNTRLPVGVNNQILVADSSEPSGLKWETHDLTDLGKVSASSGEDAKYLDEIIQSGTGINAVQLADEITLSIVPSEIDLAEADNSNSNFVATSAIDDSLVLPGTIQTSDTAMIEVAQPWEFGTATADATGTHDTLIEVSVNGVSYKLMAQAT